MKRLPSVPLWQKPDALAAQQPYWNNEESGRGGQRWHVGEVRYFPLRLGYASTVHKSQGLSLDRVQVDLREHFVGHPAMVYVALSRCRTPEGLRIVGTPELLAKRCNVDKEIVEWL